MFPFKAVTAALLWGESQHFYNRCILNMPIRITGVEMHVLDCKNEEFNPLLLVVGRLLLSDPQAAFTECRKDAGSCQSLHKHCGSTSQ